MTKSEKFFEEFYKHTVNSGVGHLLLKEQALQMLEGVLEYWPFLNGAINRENEYRIHILVHDFELFFVPAIQERYKYED